MGNLWKENMKSFDFSKRATYLWFRSVFVDIPS